MIGASESSFILPLLPLLPGQTQSTPSFCPHASFCGTQTSRRVSSIPDLIIYSSRAVYRGMSLTSLPRAVLALCLSILAVQQVSAQTVSPSNDTSNDNNVTMFILDTFLSGMETKTNISPLTPQAGMTGSLSQLEASR